MKARTKGIWACDLLHVDTVLLKRLYVLFFIERPLLGSVSGKIGAPHSCLPEPCRGRTFTKPKGKGKRCIALPPALIILLKLHREAQRLEREAAGDRWQDWDLVWCTPDGNPIDAGEDWEDWKEFLRLGEIDKDARVHDARHTAATLLLEQEVDIRVIQAVLGHSQLTTTKRYTHITETLAIEAAGRMGRALWDG